MYSASSMNRTLLLVTLLVLAGWGVVYANPKGPMSTELVITTAEITDIQFNGQAGELSFSWHGRRYIRSGRLSSTGDGEASVAAGEAILRELRLSSKVTLWVKPAEDVKQPIYVLNFIFDYPRLHEPET